MKRFAIGCIVFGLALSLACSKRVAMERAAAPAADASRVAGAAAAKAPAATEPLKPALPRKLVRTVDLELEVRGAEEAAGALAALAARLGGYVATVNTYRDEGLLRGSITLRVPVERLDEAIAGAKRLALRVDREQVKTEDVTDQYIDLDARLRTLQATEREIQALLAESRQRNRKVDEIMAIYRELTGIRSQIEQIEAQRDALGKLAALSTLNVTLTPAEIAQPLATPGWHPGETLRSSVRTLLDFLRWLADSLIWSAIVLLPVLLVLALFLVGLRRLWRWVRRSGRPRS